MKSNSKIMNECWGTVCFQVDMKFTITHAHTGILSRNNKPADDIHCLNFQEMFPTQIKNDNCK